MEDIELVIRIPEEILTKIDDENYQNVISWYATTLYCAIKNGKSLPKGHTRLFDERDIVSGNYKIIAGRIYELEPVIEADRKE